MENESESYKAKIFVGKLKKNYNMNHTWSHFKESSSGKEPKYCLFRTDIEEKVYLSSIDDLAKVLSPFYKKNNENLLLFNIEDIVLNDDTHEFAHPTENLSNYGVDQRLTDYLNLSEMEKEKLSNLIKRYEKEDFDGKDIKGSYTHFL